MPDYQSGNLGGDRYSSETDRGKERERERDGGIVSRINEKMSTQMERQIEREG